MSTTYSESSLGSGFVANPDLKEAVLAGLLRIKAEYGEVPAEQVRNGATILGISERTMWRWVQRGAVPTSHKVAWTPDPEYRTLLLRNGGSIKALPEHLCAEGTESVSARTMQRGFERTMPTVLRTFTKRGWQAAAAQMPTTSMPDLRINDEWSMDDTQLPVWCILPDGQIGKAHFQGIMDGSSRIIVGATVSPYYLRTEDAVENLANAVVGHHTRSGVFVGGKPRALRTDRGSQFVNEATTMGLILTDIDRRFSEAYTPQQNGKIERFHQFKQRLRRLPGFDWTEWRGHDPRKEPTAPPADQVLTFEELVAETMREVEAYNYDHVHTALDMTPVEAWEAQAAMNPELIERCDGNAVRAAATQTIRRKVRRRQVHLDNRIYSLHPQSVLEPDEDPAVIQQRRALIDAAESKVVTVRYLKGRVEWVSIYNSHSQYLGDAVWEQIQTVAQAGETAATRRMHIKTMTTDREDIARADAEAVASRRREALEDLAQQTHDFSLFGDPNDPDNHDAPGNHGNAVDGLRADRPEHRRAGAPGSDADRRSRTAKQPKSRKKGNAPPTPRARNRREEAEEQRRQDALDAATWDIDFGDPESNSA